MPDDTAPRRVRCLGDRPPPPELAADLSFISGFSPTARGALWSVLGPCLTDPMPPRMSERLDEFAAAHRIAGDALARAIRACRALVRGAALLDLDAETLAADARALTGPDAPVAELLLRGYGAARAQIREVAIRAAMSEHGRVLESIDWRLDQVVGSSAGGQLRFPVVILALRCRDRGVEERITLQATPAKLRELHALCEQLLGPLGGAGST